MKRIVEWLRTKFSQPSTSIAMDQPNVDNGNREQDDYMVEVSYGADAGMDVVMPDIYADVHDETLSHALLPLLDISHSYWLSEARRAYFPPPAVVSHPLAASAVASGQLIWPN